LRSRLDELSGIGPRRRKLLLTRFGSAEGVRQASVEELQAALGPLTGRRIYEQLRAV
jgi:excinuclease ABC subunit C